MVDCKKCKNYGNRCIPAVNGECDAFVEAKVENVDHPKHYVKEGRKECIDEIHEMLGDEGTICFCLGNVHKYLYRLNDKGAALNNALKAEWYANYAQKLLTCASYSTTQKYLFRLRYYMAEIEKAMMEVQND